MYKKIILSALLMCSVFALVACNKGMNILDKNLEFEVIDSKSEKIVTYLEDLYEVNRQKGYKVLKKEDGKTVIFIGLGEKNSGGYDIKINSVKYSKNKLVVDIEEVEPDTGMMTISVLTYPYVVVEVKDKVDAPIVIVDQNGNNYNEIKTVDVSEVTNGGTTTTEENIIEEEPVVEEGKILTIEGILMGFGDQNSVEVQVGQEYKTFRIDSISNEERQSLIEGEAIKIEYKEENGQLIITNIVD